LEHFTLESAPQVKNYMDSHLMNVEATVSSLLYCRQK
jgi:hypothetical protein